MKRWSLSLCVSVLALSNMAHAEVDSFDDWANVTRVTPQYEEVNVPQKECTTSYETVQTGGGNGGKTNTDGSPSYVGTAVGAVVGGVVGNQFGKGHGRDAATAAGAVVGAIIGNEVGKANRQPEQRPVQPARYDRRPVKNCEMVDHWEKQVTGYQVEYDYAGHRYTRFMTENPGRRLKVRVSVDPQ